MNLLGFHQHLLSDYSENLSMFIPPNHFFNKNRSFQCSVPHSQAREGERGRKEGERGRREGERGGERRERRGKRRERRGEREERCLCLGNGFTKSWHQPFCCPI